MWKTSCLGTEHSRELYVQHTWQSPDDGKCERILPSVLRAPAQPYGLVIDHVGKEELANEACCIEMTSKCREGMKGGKFPRSECGNPKTPSVWKNLEILRRSRSVWTKVGDENSRVSFVQV